MSKAFPYKWAAVPQRYVKGLGWVECSDHRATTWAAFKGNRLLARCQMKHEALEVIRIAKLNAAGPKRRYRIGCSMAKAEGEPLARSLTLEEFNRRG